MTTAIYIVTCVFVFVFGSVIGSFLNVVIYRTPLKQSIITEPSHCFSCGNPPGSGTICSRSSVGSFCAESAGSAVQRSLPAT